jgi:hypothetical protein
VTTTYIFHVIGTLTMAHVALAAESMGRQRFRWQNLVVHNASTLPLQPILDLMPAGQFDKVQVLDYNPKDPPTCAQDWFKQMRYVCGTDRYFSHKADFYLANGVCEAFDSLPEGDWFVPFHKYDMKSRASIATLREYAALPWEEGLKLSTTGSYQKHLGKLAIPFMQTQGVDGTIHGYTEAARGCTLRRCSNATRAGAWPNRSATCKSTSPSSPTTRGSSPATCGTRARTALTGTRTLRRRNASNGP